MFSAASAAANGRRAPGDGRSVTAATQSPHRVYPIYLKALDGLPPTYTPIITSNLAYGPFRLADLLLAFRYQVTDRRSLKTLVLECEPDDRGEDEEADRDVERPIVRRLDAYDEDQDHR